MGNGFRRLSGFDIVLSPARFSEIKECTAFQRPNNPAESRKEHAPQLLVSENEIEKELNKRPLAQPAHAEAAPIRLLLGQFVCVFTRSFGNKDARNPTINLISYKRFMKEPALHNFFAHILKTISTS